MNFFSFNKKNVVTQDTMIIMPAKSTEYCSIIYERSRTISSKDTCSEVIERSCLGGGATISGRLKSVTFVTGYDRKVPIPIFQELGVYCFPTHAADHIDCCYIFPAHIRKMMPNKNNPKQSIVIFKNNLSVILDIPYQTLLRQVGRTAHCVLSFSSWYDDGDIQFEIDNFKEK